MAATELVLCREVHFKRGAGLNQALAEAQHPLANEKIANPDAEVAVALENLPEVADHAHHANPAVDAKNLRLIPIC